MIIPYLTYLILTILTFLPILLSSGVVVGGDWGLPVTHIHQEQLLRNFFYTWINQSNLLGTPQLFHNDQLIFLYSLISRIFSVPPAIYQKLFLIIPFSLLGLGMFNFLKFLRLNTTFAFIGGLIYMYSPPFFNYSIMGWVFVILSMGILPFALKHFIHASKTGNSRQALISGLFFTLAMAQSQTIVWYPLVFLAMSVYLVKDIPTLVKYVKALLITHSVLILCLTMLWLPLFFGNGSTLNTGLGLSVISRGTWDRLNLFNILRNWGSLFNYQYEISYPQSFAWLSLTVPFLAVSSLLSPSQKRLKLAVFLPVFITVALFLAGPWRIASLPFSDIYRDIARFSVLVTFSFAILSAIALDRLNKSTIPFKHVLIVICCALLLVSTEPYLQGELYRSQKISDTDFRLRTYQYSPDYKELERLTTSMSYTKAIFIPNDILVRPLNNPQFQGNYSEISNVYANFSPIPGLFPTSDKTPHTTKLKDEINDVLKSNDSADLIEIMRRLGASMIIVLKDMSPPLGFDSDKFYKMLTNDSRFEEKLNLPSLYSFKLISPSPNFYATDNKTIYSGNRINPANYELSLKSVKGDLSIILLESFHSQWKLSLEYTLLSDENHQSIFGYANSWKINIDQLCISQPNLCHKNADQTFDLNLSARFLPQSLYQIGQAISLLSMIIITFIAIKKP